MKRSHRQEGLNALDLLEESIQLLRNTPAAATALYYLGTVPFVLAILFYWADMSLSPFARQRLASGALVLTLLFVWMKYWQTRFAAQLWAQLQNEATPRPSLSHSIQQAALQTVIQSSGWIVLPIAAIITLPFGWVYAFYQNITVLPPGPAKSTIAEAFQQSLLWPKQNHLLIWLASPTLLLFAGVLWLVLFPALTVHASEVSASILYLVIFLFSILIILLNPFGVFVAANLAVGLLFLPELLRMFFGVDTSFTRSGSHVFNSTFFAVTCGLTFLALDPLIKAAYSLRCFYGSSVKTGHDLLVQLRSRTGQNSRAATLLFCFVLSTSVSQAADTPSQPSPIAQPTAPLSPAAPTDDSPEPLLSPAQLNQSISEVLQKPEYSWRLPRDLDLDPNADQGWFASALTRLRVTLEGWMRDLENFARKLGRWVRDLFSPNSPNRSGDASFWVNSLEGLIWVLAILLALLAGLLAWRLWRTSKPLQSAAESIPDLPNLAEPNVTADQLPETGWLQMAADLISRGELRLALRALYLASLAHLADRNLVTIAKFKSNSDYRTELRRRAHALPDLQQLFAHLVVAFDRAWYGDHPVDESLIQNAVQTVEKIKQSCQSRT